MLKYAETASSSTKVLLPNPPQQDTTQRLASIHSYAIGPLDPAQLMPWHIFLPDDEEITVQVPVQIPPSLLYHPSCEEGYGWSWLDEQEKKGKPEEEWTVPRLLNSIYDDLTDTSDFRDPDTDEVWPDFLPCTVGWLLRTLHHVAETDHTLALVGMAHLCFLLFPLTHPRPSDWPRYKPYLASQMHQEAITAYRARVRAYRHQGKSFYKAQRLALA
jgi:hypothetical protein